MIDAARRWASPDVDMDKASPRKRPRPVVSCLRCRSKKLKCDRTMPCGNCTKGSTAETCTYNRNDITSTTFNAERPQTSNSTDMAPLNSLQDLQHRMAKVEELLGVAHVRRSSPTPHVEQPTPTACLPLLGTVVAEGDRSKFHGQNHRITLLDQFLDVKDFLDRMTDDEQLMASAKKVKFLQNKSKEKLVPPLQRKKDPEHSLALLKLWESLPPKPYCDRLVSIYFQYGERTMRVLHRPTFMRRYEHLWLDSESDTGSLSSTVAQLTVIMTIAYLMDGTTDNKEQGGYRVYLEGTAINHVQAWLDELGRKQRTELSVLQVEVLVLFSIVVGHTHPEKLWSSSGALVRSAMSMGLHLDPTHIKSLSPFQMEMRRRLWATILECEVQASIMSGMPLVAPELDCYNPVPANLHDEDFDEFSMKLPAPHPLCDLTNTLYQICLAKSLPQRLKAHSLMQRSIPDVDEIVEAARQLESCLSFLPLVLSLHHSQPTPGDRGDLLHRVLVEFYLRRSLLRLYKPLLFSGQGEHEAITEVRTNCINSSLAILCYQDFYNPPVLEEVLHQDLYYWLCKKDTLWSALTVCQRIKQLREIAPNGQNLAQQIYIHNGQELVKTVERTINYLIARMDRQGSDLKDIIFLSLALKWVQLPDSSPTVTQELHHDTKKILAACMQQLLQPRLANIDYRTEQDDAEPLAKRIRTSTTCTFRGVADTNTDMPRQTPDPLPISHAPAEIAEDAGQWLHDFPGLAAEFTSFQAEMHNVSDVFDGGIAPGWNWEHFWQ